MGDLNAKHNRAVWVDVPVADLERAKTFYAAVLGCEVWIQEHEGTAFGVLEHENGNGGCLMVQPGEAGASSGLLGYFNAEGRIRDAVAAVAANGGEVQQDVHVIGAHGCRAIVLDSEGNRIALHSGVDA